MEIIRKVTGKEILFKGAFTIPQESNEGLSKSTIKTHELQLWILLKPFLLFTSGMLPLNILIHSKVEWNIFSPGFFLLIKHQKRLL